MNPYMPQIAEKLAQFSLALTSKTSAAQTPSPHFSWARGICRDELARKVGRKGLGA
jgi:hypothetical protein